MRVGRERWNRLTDGGGVRSLTGLRVKLRPGRLLAPMGHGGRGIMGWKPMPRATVVLRVGLSHASMMAALGWFDFGWPRRR